MCGCVGCALLAGNKPASQGEVSVCKVLCIRKQNPPSCGKCGPHRTSGLGLRKAALSPVLGGPGVSLSHRACGCYHVPGIEPLRPRSPCQLLRGGACSPGLSSSRGSWGLCGDRDHAVPGSSESPGPASLPCARQSLLGSHRLQSHGRRRRYSRQPGGRRCCRHSHQGFWLVQPKGWICFSINTSVRQLESSGEEKQMGSAPRALAPGALLGERP